MSASGPPVMHIAPRQELVAWPGLSRNVAPTAVRQRMVEAAGRGWPDAWVKCEGFVRRHATDDPLKPPPTVAEAVVEYVRQNVDLSPGAALSARSLTELRSGFASHAARACPNASPGRGGNWVNASSI